MSFSRNLEVDIIQLTNEILDKIPVTSLEEFDLLKSALEACLKGNPEKSPHELVNRIVAEMTELLTDGFDLYVGAPTVSQQFTPKEPKTSDAQRIIEAKEVFVQLVRSRIESKIIEITNISREEKKKRIASFQKKRKEVKEKHAQMKSAQAPAPGSARHTVPTDAYYAELQRQEEVINEIIQAGFLTEQDARVFRPEIRSLILLYRDTLRQQFGNIVYFKDLTDQQISILANREIRYLIREGILTIPAAIDITQEQLSILLSREIFHLIASENLTINDALRLTPTQVTFLNNRDISRFVSNGTIKLPDDLRRKHIYLLADPHVLSTVKRFNNRGLGRELVERLVSFAEEDDAFPDIIKLQGFLSAIQFCLPSLQTLSREKILEKVDRLFSFARERKRNLLDRRVAGFITNSDEFYLAANATDEILIHFENLKDYPGVIHLISKNVFSVSDFLSLEEWQKKYFPEDLLLLKKLDFGKFKEMPEKKAKALHALEALVERNLITISEACETDLSEERTASILQLIPTDFQFLSYVLYWKILTWEHLTTMPLTHLEALRHHAKLRELFEDKLITLNEFISIPATSFAPLTDVLGFLGKDFFRHGVESRHGRESNDRYSSRRDNYKKAALKLNPDSLIFLAGIIRAEDLNDRQNLKRTVRILMTCLEEPQSLSFLLECVSCSFLDVTSLVAKPPGYGESLKSRKGDPGIKISEEINSIALENTLYLLIRQACNKQDNARFKSILEHCNKLNLLRSFVNALKKYIKRDIPYSDGKKMMLDYLEDYYQFGEKSPKQCINKLIEIARIQNEKITLFSPRDPAVQSFYNLIVSLPVFTLDPAENFERPALIKINELKAQMRRYVSTLKTDKPSFIHTLIFNLEKQITQLEAFNTHNIKLRDLQIIATLNFILLLEHMKIDAAMTEFKKGSPSDYEIISSQLPASGLSSLSSLFSNPSCPIMELIDVAHNNYLRSMRAAPSPLPRRGIQR